MDQNDKTYIYNFIFPDGLRKIFRITLDHTAHYCNSGSGPWPEWTRLLHQQCPHCRLRGEDSSHCPIAVNIADLVASFQDIASYKDCTVSCVSADRIVSKKTIVQDGLSSIMGIIMATSGCPTLDILRPMAWFHLPFASVDESLFRSASTYLLRQYFEVQLGKQPDFSLERIKEHYLRIERVNHGMLERIRYATVLDADRNAIVILNSLAQILGMEVDENLETLRPLFC
ncbi:MAG: hypothetical protein F9K32_01985 [Desulfobulbaceae bacterium]|nr:MAG: hypothetical protein F9K32_01985 [Desulfobulbaceae bacterium]